VQSNESLKLTLNHSLTYRSMGIKTPLRTEFKWI